MKQVTGRKLKAMVEKGMAWLAKTNGVGIVGLMTQPAKKNCWFRDKPRKTCKNNLDDCAFGCQQEICCKQEKEGQSLNMHSEPVTVDLWYY
jgi:hypothetical protein